MRSEYFPVKSNKIVQLIPVRIKFIMTDPKLTRWCSFLDCDNPRDIRDTVPVTVTQCDSEIRDSHQSRTWSKRYLVIFLKAVSLVAF